MSIANFVPTIWAARTKANLDKRLVLGNLANRDWEADARSGTAKIQGLGDIPVSDHSKGATVTYAAPQSTTQTLTLNQRKVAGFTVDDLDAVQANIALVERYSSRLGYALADDIDMHIASLYPNAAAGDVAINIVAVAASEVRDAFANAAQLLDSNNVDTVGRWAVISPKTKEAAFKDTNLAQATPGGDSLLVNGSIGRFMGFDIVLSNNLGGTGVAVQLNGAAAVGATSITVDALSAAVPAGTLLTFGAGRYARVTATAAASATSITVAALMAPIADNAVATYVKVRKCLFGTRDAITYAQNLNPTIEGLRDKDTTDDYIRAQQNYGALVVEPYALGTMTVTEA